MDLENEEDWDDEQEEWEDMDDEDEDDDYHDDEDVDDDDDDDDGFDDDNDDLGFDEQENYYEAVLYKSLCILFALIDDYMITAAVDKSNATVTIATINAEEDTFSLIPHLGRTPEGILEQLRMELDHLMDTFPDLLELVLSLHEVELLESIDEYVDPEWSDAATSLLGYACLRNCMPIVRLLLEYGAPVDMEEMGQIKDFQEVTLLHPIIEKSSLETLRYFIEVVDINPNRCTPLHSTVEVNNLHVDEDDVNVIEIEEERERQKLPYCADKKTIDILFYCLDPFRSNLHTKMDQALIEEQCKKVRYLLVDCAINTFGIIQSIEEYCHSSFQMDYKLKYIDFSKHYRFILKKYLQIIFESSTILLLTPAFIIQSYLNDYLGECIWHINQSYKSKTHVNSSLKANKYITMDELRYIFEDIISELYNVSLPMRYVDIGNDVPYYTARHELIDNTINNKNNYFDLQHFACDKHLFQLPPWATQEIYNSHRRCVYPPSLDLLLFVVAPNDLDCFQYLIEKLQLNPNVIIDCKCIALFESVCMTKDHPLALLLRPLPLRTLKYLIDVGKASLEVIEKEVFNNKSNLLDYIIEHRDEWLCSVGNESLVEIVKYLSIDANRVPIEYLKRLNLDDN